MDANVSFALCIDEEVLEQVDDDGDGFSFGCSYFIPRRQLLNALQWVTPVQPLHIWCTVRLFGAATTTKAPAQDLADDAGSVTALVQALHEDCSDTDIVLHVQGHCIPAHRIVLMAQSPVFRAMLTDDLREKATGQIDIHDHSADAVREMKRFMYTGKVERLKDVGADVLDLAVAYELPQLKALCIKALPSLLCKSNVSRVFATAHTHSLQELEDSAIRFLCSDSDVLRCVLLEVMCGV